jgi:hypothetical protein
VTLALLDKALTWLLCACAVVVVFECVHRIMRDIKGDWDD